jgi:hypothetical protein
MSIDGLVLKDAATSLTVAGGTDMTFSRDAVEVKNGLHVANMAEDNFIVRENATFTARNPSKQPDGTYSKAKKSVVIFLPDEIEETGEIVYNLIRIEHELHPRSAAAIGDNLWLLGGQVCSAAALSDWRSNGSLG